MMNGDSSHAQYETESSSRRFKIAVLISVAAAIYAAVQLHYALDWAKEPFPGFLVHENLVVGPDNSPDWSGRPAGVRYYDLVLEADGRPLRTAEEMYGFVRDWVATRGPQAPIPYLVDRWGDLKSLSVVPATFTQQDLWTVTFPVFFVGVVCLAAAIVIFYLRPKGRHGSIPFVSALFLVGVWFVTVFDYETNYRFLPLMLLVLPFVPAPLIHLSLVFPRPWRFVEKQQWIVILPYTLSALLAVSNFVLFYLRPGLWRYFDYASTVHILLSVLIFLASCAISAWCCSSSIDRLRAKTILVGSSIAFLLPIILALCSEIPYYTLALFMAAFPVSVAYGIIKHNLFDVDIIIRRGVEYGVLTAITAVVYLAAVFLLGRAFSFVWPGIPHLDLLFIGLTLAVALVFNRIRGRIQSVIDRLFFRSKYDYRATIHSLCDSLSSVMDLDEVLSHITGDLLQTMHVESATVLLGEEQNGVFRKSSAKGIGEGRGDLEVPASHALIRLLDQRRGPVFRSEILQLSMSASARLKCLEVFEALEARMMIPFHSKGRLIGVLALGSKRSGALFSSEDVALLRTLAAAGAVAIENARTLEDIRRTAHGLSSLNKLGEAIGSVKNLEVLLKLTLNTLCYDMKFDGVAILLTASKDGVMPIDCWTLARHLRPGTARFRISAAELPPEMAALIFPDATPRGDACATSGEKDTLEQFCRGDGKGLLFPLRSGDETLGLIAFRPGLHKQAVTESDLDVLRTLVNEVATAIRHIQTHDLLVGITDHSPSAIAVVDGKDRLIFENASFGRMFPAQNTTTGDGNVFARLCLSPESENKASYQLEILRRDGNVGAEILAEGSKYYRYSCFGFGHEGKLRDHVGLVIQDVTEEQRVREQLIHSEKVVAMGQVISGVAHELNNPLTAVVGYLDLLLRDTISEGTRERLTKANENAFRCKKIVENLVNFVRKSKTQKEPTCCNQLIQKTIDLLGYQLRVEDVRVDLRLDSQLPTTMLDPSQIQQVLLNLISNAFYAMKQHPVSGEKRLTLTTSYGQEEGLIRISVSDTGPGVAAECLDHIFEPFFTTKPPGEGTGLGLSLSCSIVENHNGRLHVASKPGEGTTFTIELPLIEMGGTMDQQTARGRTLAAPAECLVVEDEEAIRDMVAEMLEQDGHVVTTAPDGKRALEILKGRRFDFVLTDIKMPGMDGVTFYQQAVSVDSSLKSRFILITGDTIAKATERFLEESGLPVVMKPFSKEELIHTICQANEASGICGLNEDGAPPAESLARIKSAS